MVFVDEGVYDVSLNGKIAKITIKLLQNFGGMKLLGLNIDTTGSGRVTFNPDLHGVANYSQIEIEFPYSTNFDEDFTKVRARTYSLKQDCVFYLNRLIEVVRIHTNQYSIQKIKEIDIISPIQEEIIDENNKKRHSSSWDFQTRNFPIKMNEQAKVNEKILKSLLNESDIAVHNNLFLDAINYYVNGDFNQAVIIMNISLEVFVSEYLFQILLIQGLNYADAKKKVSKYFSDTFHKVMDKAFLDIEERSLKNNEILWKKFNESRQIRKNAIHPHTKKLSDKEAFETMIKIIEIIHWIDKKNSKKN